MTTISHAAIISTLRKDGYDDQAIEAVRRELLRVDSNNDGCLDQQEVRSITALQLNDRRGNWFSFGPMGCVGNACGSLTARIVEEFDKVQTSVSAGVRIQSIVEKIKAKGYDQIALDAVRFELHRIDANGDASIDRNELVKLSKSPLRSAVSDLPFAENLSNEIRDAFDFFEPAACNSKR